MAAGPYGLSFHLLYGELDVEVPERIEPFDPSKAVPREKQREPEPPAPRSPHEDFSGPVTLPKDPKALPHDQEAEEAVLGALVLDESAWADVESLTPESFYLEDHRAIFTAMLSLHEAKEGIDTLTLRNRLGSATKGGRDWGEILLGLMDRVPTAAHAKQYADIVLNKALHRDNIKIFGPALNLAFEGNGYNPLALAASVMDRLKKREQLLDHSLPEPLSMTQVLEADIPKPDWLVGNMFGKGQYMLVVGGPKLGKTIVATELVCMLAQGSGFWLKGPGDEGFEVQAPARRSLLLPAEGGMTLQQVRVETLSKRYRPEILDDVMILPAPRVDLFREPHSGVALLTKIIRKANVDLVLLDPLAKFHSGNENWASDAGVVCKALQEIRQETGVAMIVIHHTGKPGEGSVKGHGSMRLRGSTVWGADADLIVTMEPVQGEGEGGPAFAMSFEGWWGRMPDPILVWRDAMFGHTYTPMGGLSGKRAMTVDTLRKALEKGPLTQSVLEMRGFGGTAVQKLLRKAGGTIMQTPVNGKLVYYLPGQDPKDAEGI